MLQHINLLQLIIYYIHKRLKLNFHCNYFLYLIFYLKIKCIQIKFVINLIFQHFLYFHFLLNNYYIINQLFYKNYQIIYNKLYYKKYLDLLIIYLLIFQRNFQIHFHLLKMFLNNINNLSILLQHYNQINYQMNDLLLLEKYF